MAGSSFAQLSDEEYSYVTMDLQGILNLTMTSDPNVNFSFKTIADYKQGITKFNATRLDVDATVAWDLYAYASTDNWIQVEPYSTTGEAVLPAEILEVQAVNPNATVGALNFDALTSLKGVQNALGLTNTVSANTQFLAGTFGPGALLSYAPGSAQGNPATNQFRIHYRLLPEIPAAFPNSTVALGGSGFAQAGFYYLEVVYALVEDL